MAHPKRLGKRVLRASRAGLVLLVLVGCGFFLINEGLPRVLTLWIQAALRERQMEPDPVRVERIGPTVAVLAPGSVGIRNQSFTWESVEVGYSPVGLFSGTLDHVSLQNPGLRLNWPVQAVLPEGSPAPIAESGGDRHQERSQERSQVPASGQQDPEAVEQAATAQPVPPTEEAVPMLPVFTALIPGYDKIADFLEQLPFSRFSADTGQFSLGLFERPAISGTWEAFYLGEADLLSGNLFADTGSASLISTISGIRSAKAVSLHGNLTLQPAFFTELRQRFPGSAFGLAHFPVPVDNLTGELLVDWTGPGQPAISAEATLDVLDWEPLDGFELKASALMAIGTFKDGILRVNAGCRIRELSWKEVSVSSFGVRGSFKSGDRLRIESERFTLSAPGWTGQLAFRGSALVPEFAGSPLQGRLELAFSSLQGSSLSVEPGSVLLRIGETISAQASPLGLKRRLTLWVEDLSLEADSDLENLSGGFTWYNAAGAAMGSINFTGEFPLSGKMNPDFLFRDASGQSFLDGSLALDSETVNLKARGELAISWFNALNDWAGWLPGQLTGASPAVDIALENIGVFPRGRAALSMAGSGFSMDEGLSVKGIHGDLPLQFLGFPGTRSEQSWRIEALSASSFTIQDIRLRWSLPTVRTLLIQELAGQLGGGSVSVQPLTIDLLDPVIDADIRLSQVEAGLFLDWYGETRFAIEGTLSGELDLQWREGTWLVGTGGMRIDNSYTNARFVFTDEAFLRDQFAALEAVPEDLREPLLSALLRKGIRIDQLDLDLEAVPDSENISLKLTLSGETVSEEIEVPIEGLVINNLIPRDDLARLLGLLGPVRFLDTP